MKTTSIASLAVLTCSAFSFAADEATPANKQLQIYPKNLARQHIGTNLLAFDAKSRTYIPTEAAAAWLDDDVATSWPTAEGQSYYLLALSEPELLNNFCISAQNNNGKVSIYAGDEAAPPGAKSWSPVVKDVAVEDINNKRLGRSFSRFAKYVLIETNVSTPSPWYSLYIYGEKPAVNYSLQKRDQKVNAEAVFGPFVNNQTSFNLSSLYEKGNVVFAKGSEGGFVSWQKATDDNPETLLRLPASTDASMVVRFNETKTVTRVSALSDTSAKGKLELFAVEDASVVAQGSNVPMESTKPVATLRFDGSAARASADFEAVSTAALVARWTPDDGQQPMALRELNSFNGISINEYAVVADPSAVAELGDDASKGGATSDSKGGDFKTAALDFKGGKGGMPEPVAEFLPTKSPFLPGGLGFPPNIPGVSRPPETPVLPPEEPEVPPQIPPNIPPEVPPQIPPIIPPELPPEEPLSP